MPDDINGPYLTTAVLCQAILQEANGQISLIRLTDSIMVQGPLKDMQPIPIVLHAVVSFRAGFVHGKFEINVTGRTPSQNEFLTVSQSVYFEGEDRGVNAIFVLQMLLPEDGVYWFDVRLQGAIVTRMPLRVLYQQLALAQPGTD